MNKVIETARCNLTDLHADDAENFVRLHIDKRVRRYLGGTRAEEYLRLKFTTFIQSNSETNRWAVRLKQDGAFIGIISLGAHHDGFDTEISYQFLPKWWGQGYATETVEAVVNYALKKLNLRRVIAETQTANVASCRLLERVGMRRDRIVSRFGAEQVIYTTAAIPKT